MKKIMILGAGKGQVPFIKISKELGAFVIAVSPKGNYPGIDIADKFYDMDTRDKDGILEVALKEKIDAITTDQTDVSVPTVAYVAEKLGLKGIGYDRAMKYSNKYLMRIAAREAGVAVPEFFRADNIEEAVKGARELEWPLIIKPVDSSGSRGVLKINSEDELIAQFEESKKYSITGDVIIEEYIEGIEYIVDGFSIDNRYINTDLSVKQFFNVENMCIPRMCMFSSALDIEDEKELKVLEANKKFVEYVGLPFGITHAAYIYDLKRKDAYMVEIAARGGGDGISSNITPRVSGINTNYILLDYLINGKVSKSYELKKSMPIYGYTSFALKKGKICKVEGLDKIGKIEGVDLNDLHIGEYGNGLNDNTDKYGPIFFEAESRKEGYMVLDEIQSILKVLVDGVKGNAVIW